jgi:hypothetical protein
MASFRTSIPAIVLTALATFASVPAGAACFESGIGCTNDHLISTKALRSLSCDSLWTVRNTIYDENGYCFKTAKAKAVFDNAGCTYTNASQVPLNTYERGNIDRIVKVEKQKGC